MSYFIDGRVFFKAFTFISYLTIWFWIDWVRLYKIHENQRPRLEKNYITAKEQTLDETIKRMLITRPAHLNTTSDQLLSPSKFCSLRMFFFSTNEVFTCSYKLSALSSDGIRGPTRPGKARLLSHSSFLRFLHKTCMALWIRCRLHHDSWPLFPSFHRNKCLHF